MRQTESQRPAEEAYEALTDRHRTCLRLAARGLSSTEIARALSLSPRTVDEHIANACAIFGVRTRIQAVALLTAMERSESRSFIHQGGPPLPP